VENEPKTAGRAVRHGTIDDFVIDHFGDEPYLWDTGWFSFANDTDSIAQSGMLPMIDFELRRSR
jgi:hypothetical protein